VGAGGRHALRRAAAWYEAGVRRYGFHGASHKFIAERSAELLGRDDIAESAPAGSTRAGPRRSQRAQTRCG
jgi:hypothetical protein